MVRTKSTQSLAAELYYGILWGFVSNNDYSYSVGSGMPASA